MKAKIVGLVVLSLLVGANPSSAGWQSALDVPGSVQALLFKGTDLFAGAWFPGVFLSTDSGTSWTEVNNGLQSTDVFALAVHGDFLFAGTYGGGVFRSSDNGTSWTAVNAGLTVWEVMTLAVQGTNLFAGTWGGGAFRSTNDGMNWTAVNTGLPTNAIVQVLAASGDALYAGTGGPDPQGAFVSTNGGTTWTGINAGLTNPDVRAFAQMESSLFAGTAGGQGGVFVTTDGGTTWTEVTHDLTSPAVFSFAVSGTVLFVGTSGGGVYHTTNGGGNWIQDGPPPYDVNTLAFDETYLFAGVYQGEVLRRPLSEMTTSTELPGGLPGDFALEQNYPNPLHTTTAIRFTIPVQGWATLKMYEIGGREIATLVDGMVGPGVHVARWDPGSRANGVYLYRLRTPGFTKTRRMLLLK